MEILRKAGADVNARITDVTSLTARIARTNTLTDRQGQTTLFLAAESRTNRGGQLPARHGAKMDLQDDAGKTPIDLAAARDAGRDEARSRETSPCEGRRSDTRTTVKS